MRFSALSLLAFAGASIAHPLEPRNDPPKADKAPSSGPPNQPVLPKVLSTNDLNVLNLALFLENLEFNLYSGGYNNYSEEQYAADGFPIGFRANVAVIADVCLIPLSLPIRAPLHLPQLPPTQPLTSPPARAHPHRNHLYRPHHLRQNPPPTLHLRLPRHLPQILRRPRQRHHLHRHRCLPRGRRAPLRQRSPPHRRLLHPNSRSAPRLLPARRPRRLPLPQRFRHLARSGIRVQPSARIHRVLPARVEAASTHLS